MRNEAGERYLILSDIHVPDQDNGLIKPLIDFINYYKPTHVDFLGDFFNFTKISSYAQDPFYKTTLVEEIEEGKELLRIFTKAIQKNHRGAEITFFEGNHENRLNKFIAKNAPQLAELLTDGEYTLSVPSILRLKDLDIKWIPYYQLVTRYGVVFNHGHRVRSKAGHTAHANLDTFGMSGFSGHTHKLAHITRTQGFETKFWLETGCLCSLKPTPTYTVAPDWSHGFATADLIDGKLYPTLVPIIDHKFSYNGILFK